MNFLAIVKQAVIESGLHDTGPTTVIGQTGDFAKFVAWVQQEWLDIQISNPAWQWMRQTATLTTSADKDKYTATELNLDVRDFDLQQPKVYLSSAGVSGELHLEPISYDDYRYSCALGLKQTGQPQQIAEYKEALYLYPVPDDEYIVTFDYYTNEQALTANLDVPNMPARFHRMLVDGALIRYAMNDDAPEIAMVAGARYAQMRSWLERSQGQEISMYAEPLC